MSYVSFLNHLCIDLNVSVKVCVSYRHNISGSSVLMNFLICFTFSSNLPAIFILIILISLLAILLTLLLITLTFCCFLCVLGGCRLALFLLLLFCEVKKSNSNINILCSNISLYVGEKYARGDMWRGDMQEGGEIHEGRRELHGG